MSWPPLPVLMLGMEPPIKQGRYEVHPATIRGVELMAIMWIVPGEPPMLLTTLSPDRLRLLGEALCAHLAGNPADAG
jgi:hypothetical protein